MSIYDYTLKDIEGDEVCLKDFEGKVLLVLNSATGCGFTPQYEDLEALYADYRDKGFEILDFPCNQFANQAPGTDQEIRNYCMVEFGAQFPQFSKIEVNGDNALPLFVELATAKPYEGMGKGIKAMAMNKVVKSVQKEFGDKAYIMWNFTKFLLDREGNVVARFEPTTSMDDVRKAVEGLL